MALSDRIRRLRQGSLDAVETLSSERAELLTDFYESLGADPHLSVPMQRALAFQHLLAGKAVHISPGELIVGEKGPLPKQAPTYPELCCHSLADLDMLDGRPKTPFRVDPQTRRVHADRIIPFWQGRTMRERIFKAMSPAWLAAYEAGIFTEFMEQRAPGHTVLDDKIYRLGMLDFMDAIDASLRNMGGGMTPAGRNSTPCASAPWR